jgi:hypothetical protein
MTAGPDASGHDTGAMGARRAHWIDHRPAVLGGIVVIVLVLGGLTGWAATAPLASAVIAPGTIVVDGKRKQVQHLEGGVVESIHVGDGAQVQAGELPSASTRHVPARHLVSNGLRSTPHASSKQG